MSYTKTDIERLEETAYSSRLDRRHQIVQALIGSGHAAEPDRLLETARKFASFVEGETNKVASSGKKRGRPPTAKTATKKTKKKRKYTKRSEFWEKGK